MDRKTILLLIVPLVTLVAVSSYQLIEVTKLRDELNQMREQLAASTKESGQYWYNSDWVTKFIGYNPIASTEEAKELYLSLVDKAPRKSYWIIYWPEDYGMPLTLEALDVGTCYTVNGTFRNFAVNCLDAKLIIVYNVFKNGTATLDTVMTKASGYEYQEYP